MVSAQPFSMTPSLAKCKKNTHSGENPKLTISKDVHYVLGQSMEYESIKQKNVQL